MSIDPQLHRYDDFDEDPQETFRIFDEGDKRLTTRPAHESIFVAANGYGAPEWPAIDLAALARSS